MNKLVQLTAASWILRAGIEDSGLLFKRQHDYLFLSPTKRLEFASLDAVKSRWRNLKEEVLEETTVGTITINGFPVKHQDVTIVSETPALYNKGSSVVFAAGYWGLKFANGWTLALCPKHKTTLEHQTAGPYRNRLEALNQLSALNNKRNLNQRT